MNSNWSVSAALAAAGAASLCCTVPFALVSLGVGGAWIGHLTALSSYRWIFVGFAVVALGYAGYGEWRMSQRPDCDCETVFSSTTRRLFFGLGTLAVLVLLASPWFVASSSGTSGQQARAALMDTEPRASPPSTTPDSVRQVVLTVDGMTCAGCSAAVRTALRDLDGVSQARVTLEPPRATVRFDPDTVSVEQLTQATDDAGFPSQLKPSS